MFKKDSVISFPCGKTYDLVRKYLIHAHPVKKGFPPGDRIPRFLMARAKGGFSNELFMVFKTIEFNPYDTDKLYEYQDEAFFLNLIGYIDERKADFGFEYAPNDYRFYILTLVKIYNPPFVIKQNTQGYRYLSLDEVGFNSDTKENDFIQGSPEWFNSKSTEIENLKVQGFVESLRAEFIERFSYAKLSDMSGEELLDKVFGDNSRSMMNILMSDDDYRWFGAAGYYKYLGVIYQDRDGKWNYKENVKPESLSYGEAAKRAESVRDKLLGMIDTIENTDFESVSDYISFQDSISNVFFYKFPWCLKYFQMLYPQYFPGMYADKTIERALGIIGLPNHGKTNRIVNAGEIALFIRRCSVNNIVFNNIYGTEWGWEGDRKPCQNAQVNYDNRTNVLPPIDLYKYNLYEKTEEDEYEYDEVKKIGNDLEDLNLKGKEKLAIVKVRINHSKFRDKLLSRYKKCCLCGVRNNSLLIASHIKPWSVSSPEERVDVNNGLLLCPNHDKLFDSGFISFENSGRIIISDRLNEHDRVYLNISKDMSIDVSEGNIKYLEYHRENVFDADV